MRRASSSSNSDALVAGPVPRPLAAAGRSRGRRPLPAVAAVLAAVLMGGAVVAWQWHRRAWLAPPAATLGLQPVEARLLAAVQREPTNPRPCQELGEEYAASSRPASALWAYSEAAARAPADNAVQLKLALTLRQL